MPHAILASGAALGVLPDQTISDAADLLARRWPVHICIGCLELQRPSVLAIDVRPDGSGEAHIDVASWRVMVATLGQRTARRELLKMAAGTARFPRKMAPAILQTFTVPDADRGKRSRMVARLVRGAMAREPGAAGRAGSP
ncbi:MAG: hypothetical protein QJR08_00565 [Bacillota bacterium]|nr:hypothetical protein [Bacillota bacterium]